MRLRVAAARKTMNNTGGIEKLIFNRGCKEI
jgi:hypothetical protein